MALPAVSVAAGEARGVLHLVDDPLQWRPATDTGPSVLALPALWWPPTEELPPGTVAVILHGIRGTRRVRAKFPVVAGVDRDVLLDGETVEVNGSDGTISIAGVEEVEVVTSFLERDDGAVLLLERSEQVGTFRGRWAGVSGFLEDPSPLDQALREVQEETGLAETDLQLAAAGLPVLARDGRRIYIVHPFRFRVRRTDVVLDWEHRRAEWVSPAEIARRPTVPKLDRAYEAVAPAPEPKA